MLSTPVPYPVNLCLTGQPVLVVGGGPVAARKVAALLRAGAVVTVVAPTTVDAIAENPKVAWQERTYNRGEAGSYRLVVTATNDPVVNSLVARDCEAAGVFVNSADDPANCTFTLPSVARRGDLQVAVSTNGRSPALARWLRRRIEPEIDSGYTALLELLAQTRAEVRVARRTSEVPGWEAALDAGLLELVRAGRKDEARSLLRRHLQLDGSETDTAEALAS
ncbi:MAG: bifunctional precorrin-2 dehydrogenase/sirohydrochlorin ferrochelatase [Acidimicrobiaceae bacterium]|nr:bifunctional precorrin-2 dehydrogenase/sirohydrochlorin ferrochelatase [Acidimicrobiaceae bacterium]